MNNKIKLIISINVAVTIIMGIILVITALNGKKESWQRDWLFYEYATQLRVRVGDAVLINNEAQSRDIFTRLYKHKKNLFLFANTDRENEIADNYKLSIEYLYDTFVLGHVSKISITKSVFSIYCASLDNYYFELKKKWQNRGEEYFKEGYDIK